MKIEDEAIYMLSKSIIGAVNKSLVAAPFDKIVDAKITAVLDTDYYTVSFRGGDYNLYAVGHPEYEVNDSVKVAIPENDYNRMFILLQNTGDMTKAVYDEDDDGVVDDSEKLGGQLPNYYYESSNIESGLWTPVLYGTTTAGSPTGTFYGEYVKTGDLVTCFVYISLTSKGGIVGSLRISGLPFASDASSSFAESFLGANNITRTGICSVSGLVIGDATYVSLRIHYEASGVLSNGALADTHITNDTYIRGVITYKTD